MTDKRFFQSALRDIAARAVPGDMPSLWPRIESRLGAHTPPRRPRRFPPLTRLGWIAATLAISLMVGAGTYAFYQSRKGGFDPGLAQVQEQNLITRLDQSQTIDALTVTLDWAYADAHRIALTYRVTGTSDDGVIPNNTGMPTLTNLDTGQSIPPMFGGGGGGGGGESGGPVSFVMEANANFDASVIEGAPAVLRLRLDLEIGQSPADDSGPGLGGGGGGGGSSETPPETRPPSSLFDRVIGPFVFEFSLPLIPAVVLTPGQAVEANGITMTLARVAITPSLTRMQVCYTMPDDRDFWQPVSRLEGEAFALEPTSIGAPVAPTAGPRCFDLGFLAPYDGAPTRWTLRVDRLRCQQEPIDPDVLKQAFAARGVEIVIYPDGGWEITSHPEGIDMGAVIDEVYDSLAEQHPGPWVFDFAVPES